MDTGDIAGYAAAVATYAALVATGSLVWQVISWRAQRQPKVLVTSRWSETEGLTITVTNRSDFKIRVARVGWAFIDDERVRWVTLDEPEQLYIQSMDSWSWEVSLDDFERHGAPVGTPCGGWVRLSTDELFDNLEPLYTIAGLYAYAESQVKVYTDRTRRNLASRRRGRRSLFGLRR